MTKLAYGLLINTALLVLVAPFGFSATGVAQVSGTVSTSPISGTVMFTDTKEGLKVSAEIKNAPAGQHGFHIHEFGNCSDMAKAAGSHYNPMGVQHGDAVKNGLKMAHAGDLGNITVDANGNGKLEGVLHGVTLAAGKYTVGGRAVILHEKADDFGQPVGNAGGRIGCGPIIITGQ